MDGIQQQESSYDEGSSHEIIVEFGQVNKELIGSKVTDKAICGDFGVAQIFKNKGDKLIVLDPTSHELKIINQIYRGIVVKSVKKKQPKNPELKNQQINAQEIEVAENSSENLFDSSQSSHEQLAKKKKKKKENGKASEIIGKTRIIRKIRTLSKKQQMDEGEK